MTYEINTRRMEELAGYIGQIGIENDGEDTEIVVRIPVSSETAESMYDRMGEM